MTLFIGNVKDIKWNEHAFEKLVLPEDHKELILALTESQRANKNAFDDIIQGKGKPETHMPHSRILIEGQEWA